MIDTCTNTCMMLAAFRIWDSGVKKLEFLEDGCGNARRSSLNKVTQADLLFNCFGNNVLCSSDFYCSLWCAASQSLWKIYLLSLSGTLFFSLWVLFYISHPQLVLKGFFISIACRTLFILLSFLLTTTEELCVLPIKDEIFWKTKLMQLSVPWP